MKKFFAIRDDDLNYFHDIDIIEDNLKEIWQYGPVSMSAIPFVMGNWHKNTTILDMYSGNTVPEFELKKIIEDKKTYPIGENKILVKYIKQKIKENKIELMIHGINHRNDDDKLILLKNNYAIGAEFNTNQNKVKKLKEAKNYLEKIFETEIKYFAPPQNSLNYNGIKSIISSDLNICAYPHLAGLSIMEMITTYGVTQLVELIGHKILNKMIKKVDYPYNKPLKLFKRNLIMCDHRSIQTGTDIDSLFKIINCSIREKEKFILSTHSHAFNEKISTTKSTIKEYIIDMIDYCNEHSYELVGINKLYENNN